QLCACIFSLVVSVVAIVDDFMFQVQDADHVIEFSIRIHQRLVSLCLRQIVCWARPLPCGVVGFAGLVEHGIKQPVLFLPVSRVGFVGFLYLGIAAGDG